MNTCPTCQTTHPDTVRICPRDGTVLSPASDDPRVGTTLDGKYRLDTVLGRGGMGSIYRATHLMLDKPVAVKLINADLAPTPDMVRRFQREARAASNLNHPNIAAAFDLGQTTDGTLYIAMELVSGQSLKEAIRNGGPMAPARIVRILGQVASALGAAHASGIIHRDLKPQNIMLTQAGGGEVAKLLDFGIAKTFDDNATQLTSTGLVLGTPQYMSPEQAAGRPIDGRSDLYSLGIILFEMLVGEVPFNDPSTPAVLVKHLTEPAPPPSKRRPDLAIPVALESVALRCLEKEPGARYQTATDFATALEQAGVAYGAGASPSANEATVIVTPRAETPTERTAPITTPTLRTDSTQPVPASAVPPPPPAARQTAATVVPPVVPAPSVAPPAAPPVAPPVVAPPAAARPAAATAVSAPPPLSVAGGSAGGATPALAPASRSVAPGLAVISGVLLLLLVAAYGLMAGWFGGVSGTDSPAPLQASAPSVPSSGVGAPNAPPPGPSSPPSSPSAGSQSAAAQPSAPGSASGSSSLPGAATPPAPAQTASSSSRSGAAVAASGSTAPPVRSAPAGSKPAPAAPPVQPRAANPTVVFRCAGESPICSSLRSAIGPAFQAQSIVSSNDPQRADILVSVQAEFTGERREQMFGTTIVTRSYSIDVSGQTQQNAQDVPMPPPTSVSYDARVGQEKLNGEMRVLAAAVAEKIRGFWK